MGLKKLKLAILISGRGSNMESIIRACEAPDFPAKVELVVSNRPQAEGLRFAKEQNIKTIVVDHKKYKNRDDFEDDLYQSIKAYNPDILILAGFMRILGRKFGEHWPERLLNIHPSLLPDYKGTKTHERVLADKRKETGCTVHYVIPELDSGPIIVQKRVPVQNGDTPETLSERVLEQEHIAYPEAIKIVSEKLLNNKNST